MSRYNYRPDDSDLERSYELERKLDRNEEREPSIYRVRKPRRRLRYFAGLMFRPAQPFAENDCANVAPETLVA